MRRLSLNHLRGPLPIFVFGLLAGCDNVIIVPHDGGAGAGAGGGMPEILPPVELCDNGTDDDGDGNDCSVHANWSGRFGTEQDDLVWAVHTGPHDSILIAGTFSGSFTLSDANIMTTNQTESWPFAARFDSTGHVISARYLEAFGTATAIDGINDDIFIGGAFFENKLSKFYIRHLKPDMQTEWQYESGFSPWVGVAAISVDPVDHTLLVAGTMTGDIAFPGCSGSPAYTTSTYDGFIMKLDPDTQSCAWAFPIRNGSIGGLIRRGNEMLVVGSYVDNAVALPGAPKPDDAGAFIASFDIASQALLNVKYFLTDGPGRIDFDAFTIDTSGNVYVAGDFWGEFTLNGKTLVSDIGNGGDDGFVAAFDADLNPRWINRYGGGGLEIPRSIVAFNDTVYVSGTTIGGHPITPLALQPWNCGSNDVDCMFLLNLRASDGTTRWCSYFGVGDRPNFATPRLAAGANSDLWLAAGWMSEINFGDKPLLPIGSWNQDIVIAKFSPAP